MNTSIVTARSRKSHAAQLFEIAGHDTDIDLVLAGNPNASAQLLDLLSNHMDQRVRRKVARHPTTPIEALVRLGSAFPVSLFNNPVLPDLLTKGKNFASMFEPVSLREILRHKKCPNVLGEWVLKYGNANQQAAYLVDGKRSDQMAMLFCKSRYLRIVNGLMQIYDVVYIAWATELGWIPEPPDPDDEYPFSMREEIDFWLSNVDHTDQLWEKLVPKSGCAETLQGELVRAHGRLMDELYRNGMMNWGSGFYEGFAKLIHSTLKSEKRFSKLMKKIIDSEISCIVDSGKSPGPHNFNRNFLIASDVEVT